MGTALGTPNNVTSGEFFEQYVSTWMRGFRITQVSKKAKQRRLQELQTWDTCNGNQFERETKIEALNRLLNA